MPPINEQSLLDRCAEAAETVYSIDQPTPVEELYLPGNAGPITLKREDLSRVRSYKWRGAFNKMSRCVEAGDRGPFLATSAGNHAQGVAIAAAKLGVDATVFMPQSTPRLKQDAVIRHGAGQVQVHLEGDSFEQALDAANRFGAETNATVLPPFDDPDVIAGQSTVAREILDQVEGVETVFVPIGGGGLASGVAFLLKHLAPDVRVIGVEVDGQDSMSRSIRASDLLSLPRVDRFCDGTAVATPGRITMELCSRYLSETITITNTQVCAAIQLLWEQKRLVPEPSGAIALAGLLLAMQDGSVDPVNEKCVCIVSGGNVDFLTLPLIVKGSQAAQPSRRYFRFHIDERNGSLIGLLDKFLDGINIVDFRYGKTGHEIASPVLGLQATSKRFEEFIAALESAGQQFEDVTEHQATMYRIIAFRPDLASHPYFLHIDFPDRPGALRDLMRKASPLTSICYFNFNDTGQAEGHALIGFEFTDPADRDGLHEILRGMRFAFKAVDVAPLMSDAKD